MNDQAISVPVSGSVTHIMWDSLDWGTIIAADAQARSLPAGNVCS